MASNLQDQDYKEIETWVSELRSGNNEHEEQFFKQLALYIKPIILGKLGAISDDTLSDLSSTIIISVWNNLQLWDKTRGAFLTWVAVITHNKVVDYIRLYNRESKKSVDLAIEDVIGKAEPKTLPEETLDEVIQREQSKLALIELVKSIDPLDRTIYLYRINYDLSFVELTEIVQGAGYPSLSAKAVEQRFYRTRNKLKKKLEMLSYI